MNGYDVVAISEQAAKSSGHECTKRAHDHLVIHVAGDRARLHVRPVTSSRMEVIFGVGIRALWPEALYPGPLSSARSPLDRCPVMLGSRRDTSQEWCSGVVHALCSLLDQPEAIIPMVKLLLDAHEASGAPRAFKWLECEEWYHEGRWCVRLDWEKKEPGLLSRVKEGEPERTLGELVTRWCEALSCLMRASHTASSPRSVLDVWSPLLDGGEHAFTAYPELGAWCRRELERVLLALLMTDRAMTLRGWPRLVRPELGVYARVAMRQGMASPTGRILWRKVESMLSRQWEIHRDFDHDISKLEIEPDALAHPMMWALSFLPDNQHSVRRDHGTYHLNPDWQRTQWRHFDPQMRRDALAHLGNTMCAHAGLGPQQFFVHGGGMVLPWPGPEAHGPGEIHEALMQGRPLSREGEVRVLVEAGSPPVIEAHDLISQALEHLGQASPWLELTTGYEWMGLWWRVRLAAYQIPRAQWHTGQGVDLFGRYGAMYAMTSRFFDEEGRVMRAWLRFMRVADQYSSSFQHHGPLATMLGKDPNKVWLEVRGMQAQLLALPGDGTSVADWEVEVVYTFLLKFAQNDPAALCDPALYAPWMAMAMTRLHHRQLAQLDRMLEFVPMPEVLAHLDRLVHHHPDPVRRAYLEIEQRQLAEKIASGKLQVVSPHLEGAVQIAEQAGEQGGLSLSQKD